MKTTVAVVGLADGPEADAGSGILACLDAARFERIAIVAGHTESGAYRRDIVDRAFRVANGAFAEELAHLVKEEGIDVVLPGSRRSILPLARAAGQLDAAVPLPDPALCEKLALEGIDGPCRRFDLPRVPVWLLPEGVGIPPQSGYPTTLITPCGDRYRVSGPHELLRTARRLSTSPLRLLWHDPFHAFETAIVIGRDGLVLASAAVRVLADDDRERPWMAVTVDHPDLRKAAGRLASAMRLEGPVAMTFTQEQGKFLAVDARPGLPLWIEACTVGGPNLVEILVEFARGASPPPQGHVAPGVLFSQTAHDLWIDAGDALRLVGRETS